MICSPSPPCWLCVAPSSGAWRDEAGALIGSSFNAGVFGEAAWLDPPSIEIQTCIVFLNYTGLSVPGYTCNCSCDLEKPLDETVSNLKKNQFLWRRIALLARGMIPNVGSVQLFVTRRHRILGLVLNCLASVSIAAYGPENSWPPLMDSGTNGQMAWMASEWEIWASCLLWEKMVALPSIGREGCF